MSVHNITKAQQTGTHQDLPYEGRLNQVYGKMYAESTTANSELRAWLEQARIFHEQVMSGEAEMPDQASWQTFLNDLQWAEQQLWGNGSNWDGLGGADGNISDYEPPFGGHIGANGEIVYTEPQTRVGFLGEEGPFHVYSYDFILDIATTSANVTIEKTTYAGSKPEGEMAYKVTVEDEATGQKPVYYLHNIDEIENFTINLPGAKSDRINNLTDNPNLVEIGEFQEGSLGEGNGGPKPSAVDGNTAYYDDAVAGESYVFRPPFGGYDFNYVYGNMDLAVKNSDEVYIEHGTPDGEGGMTITIESKDGSKKTFYLDEGFQLNLQAHAPNVHFITGDGSSGDIGDISNGGPNKSGEITGDEGVPADFAEYVTLNGANSEDGTGSSTDLPDNFLTLLDMLGINLSDVELEGKEYLLEELRYGVPPPSQDLMNFIGELDKSLQDAWTKMKANPEDDFAWKQVQEKLVRHLNVIYGPGTVSADGDFPAGVNANDLLEAKTLFISGTAFEIGEDLSLTRMKEDVPETASALLNAIEGLDAEDIPKELLQYMENPTNIIPEWEDENGNKVNLAEWLYDHDADFRSSVDGVNSADDPNIEQAYDRFFEIFQTIWGDNGTLSKSEYEGSTRTKDDIGIWFPSGGVGAFIPFQSLWPELYE